MAKAYKIVVFDSGIGGLTILQDIQKVLPNAQYIFVSDNAGFPYGIKTEEALIARVLLVFSKIAKDINPDMAVIACNSASTIVLPLLRAHYKFPIVGVVPAIKPAAIASKNKVIGLLATPATIKRHYTQDLINSFAKDCDIILCGSSELVHLSEQKFRGEPVCLHQLKQSLQPIVTHPCFSKMDVLVLGCTHFPFLNNELKQVLPQSIQCIDSGAAIARQVLRLVGKTQDQSTQLNLNKAYFTQKNATNDMLQIGLQPFNINQIDYFSLLPPLN